MSILHGIICFKMPKKLKYELQPIDATLSHISERISQLRKKRGLTQKELSAKIGITQTLVSDYETGRSHLTDTMLIRFCLALSTTPNVLLSFNNEAGKKTGTQSLKLMKRINRIEKLPLSKQKALLQIIDGFLDSAHV
jgi:transcriptional regulator with XRE-family HTH domain